MTKEAHYFYDPEDLIGGLAEGPFVADHLETIRLSTVEARELESLGTYTLGKPVVVVNQHSLLVYDKAGHSLSKSSYNCHTSTSEHRYLRIDDELRKLPTKLSDSHGAASICNSCPHQLKCAVGTRTVIMPNDFPQAEQSKEIVPMVKAEDQFGNLSLHHLTMSQMATLARAVQARQAPPPNHRGDFHAYTNPFYQQ